MSRFATLRLAGLLALLCLVNARLLALPAFPGAEGFGANSPGGRGGTVYHVTNLNDSGAGSFRDAVSASNRTVVFDVGGIIVVSSPVVVKSNITIAGQTAPGQGITIYGDRLSFSDANNTLVRYMRFREGINGDSGTDAVGAASGNLMMFDHVSASWGRDETFSLSGTPSNITLQDCIIGQGLLIHSAGGLVQTDGGVSIFRTLYIDNYMRNPKIKGVNDYQNNVVYNWGSGGGYIPAGDSAGYSYANMIGNYFISGPTTANEGPFKTGNNKYNLFHSGNLQDLNRDGILDAVPVTNSSFPTLTVVATQFNYPKPATLLTAEEALAHILANAGASLYRDSADTYMMNELASNGTVGAHISNESEVGGIGVILGGVAAKDTDGDGMPDWWEEAAGTNPIVADNNGDLNGDGYTNLENYLNAIARGGVPAATIDSLVSDTGSSASDGITSVGALVFRGKAAPGLTVSLYRVDQTAAIGTAVADASGNWTFDYSATPLPDRYYAFMATVALPSGLTSPPTRAFVVKVDTTAAATPVITSIVTSPSFALNGTSEPGSSIAVTLAGTGVVATTTTDAIGNWTASYPGGSSLAPGVYTFTATATDLAGNRGAASADYVINTGIAAPVFTGITTDSGTVGDQLTNDTTLTFNGTATAGATITLTRAGTGVIGTTTAAGDGTWSVVYGTTLTAGTHSFTATASTGGNSSPASPAYVVTVDTTKPTIASIRRLTPSTTATTASTLVFRVTVAEPVTGVDQTDFSLTLAGTTGTISGFTAQSSTVYDVTVTGVSGDGTVRLDLKASGTAITDLAGNVINSAAYTSGQTYTIRLPGSGVWVEEDGGLWSVAANWENNIIATGAGATADFASRNLLADLVVQLDSPRTLGRLVFGDTDFSTQTTWTLSNNGNAANVLTLSGTSPNIQVDALVTTGDTVDVPIAAAYPATLDVVLAGATGTTGFTKTGVGTLQITQPATITGPLTITKGIVQVASGGSISPSSVTISTSQQLRVVGGSFTTPGNVTWTSGTGTGIIVSGGTASFQKILPSNVRNSFVKVTGGTMTATEINFPRSGDSESQAIASGILISGGDTTVGTVGLGTADSWGALTISGGKFTVTGALNNGYQKTSTRGGVIGISAGEFNVTDTAANSGLILGRNPGGSNANTNNVAKFNITGGVSNIGRITLGYDSTSSAGSSTVSVAGGGELNLGTGGIVKNGASGLASSITLTAGTLGAYAPWSTTHPIALAGTPATVALRATTSDFTLSGGLTGSGGFAKTGAGTVTVAGNSTFTGDVAVNAGTLATNGVIAAGGAFSVNSGGTLAGSGTINRAVTLASGGTVSPAGSGMGNLTATSLAWNGGGALALNLGASDVSDTLILTGALAKGSAGSYALTLAPGSGFAAGNVYTVATFASTGFAASDFTVTGLPAGYGAAVTLTGTSLKLTIVIPPSITSPATASGTYGSPFGYAITAANSPASFSASGLPSGLNVDPLSGAITGTPDVSGTFNVTLGAANAAGYATAPLTLTVNKAPATVTLGGLTLAYDGTGKSPTPTTSPAGLTVTYTYNGSPTAPTTPGTYAVVATIADANYTGTINGTLVITATAIVRHAPTLNGGLDGSVQILLPETTSLATTAWVSGDLLIPGLPAVTQSATATYGGTLDGTGSDLTGAHTVSLNGNSVLRHVVRRTDAVTMPTVTAPPAPVGTRNVSLTAAGQSPGDFATLRNLTLASNAGPVSIPPGTYGTFTGTGNSAFVLGVVGATEPAVYNLQTLSLNVLAGNSQIQVVGPVVINVASTTTLIGLTGSSAHPEWLTIRVAAGGVTVNGNGVTVYATVIAPNSTVTLGGTSTLHGTVTADRLTLNASALLNDPGL